MNLPSIKNAISSLFGGTENPNRFATVKDLNAVINQINQSSGSPKLSIVYSLTEGSGGNDLVPIHIEGADPLPSGATIDDCKCTSGSERTKTFKKVRTYTNGLRGCVECSSGSVIDTAFVAPGQAKVILPVFGQTIQDYTVTINSNASPNLSLGIQKTGSDQFIILIYDIATDAYVSTWPAGSTITIDYYLGDVAEA